MKGKLCFGLVLILLPAMSHAQETNPADKFRSDKKYENTLSIFQEPHIAPASNLRIEIYRIFVIPTFYHPLSIRVEKSGKDYVLVAKRLSGQGGYSWGTLRDEKKRRLTEREWQSLFNLLAQATFWSLPTSDKEFEPNEKCEVTLCLDSTAWILEGASGGKYHVVDRYCPAQKGVKEVGLYMVKLTKWGIKESDLR